MFDPHHDHLTGAYFAVSAAGVQKDSTIFNDTSMDQSWDAVWESAVTVDESGWSLEMRIPYSQLRFPSADRLTFGINAMRYIQRKKEQAWLVHVPKSDFNFKSLRLNVIFRWELKPGSTMYVVWTEQRQDLVTG